MIAIKIRSIYRHNPTQETGKTSQHRSAEGALQSKGKIIYPILYMELLFFCKHNVK
jgi:hypothetical protein